MIHESRFTFPSYGLAAVADLGEHWERRTGRPIPLGAIVARRDLDPAPLVDAVRRSVGAAWADPAARRAHVAAHAQEMDPAVADQHIALYVNDFTRDLGDEGYAAVSRCSRAADLGLVPPVDPARWPDAGRPRPQGLRSRPMRAVADPIAVPPIAGTGASQLVRRYRDRSQCDQLDRVRV